LLKEADGAPTRAYRTSEERAHPQNGAAQLIKRGEGLIVERFVARERDESENYCEEAGEAWKGTDPISYVGTETGRVGRVEQGA
jgi:hypothetical protein